MSEYYLPVVIRWNDVDSTNASTVVSEDVIRNGINVKLIGGVSESGRYLVFDVLLAIHRSSRPSVLWFHDHPHPRVWMIKESHVTIFMLQHPSYYLLAKFSLFIRKYICFRTLTFAELETNFSA
jgi:hypothetical protein